MPHRVKKHDFLSPLHTNEFYSFLFNHNFLAKKSKASIEIIVKSQPDRYKENEVWYDGGQDKGNVGNHVDHNFADNGK